MATVLKSIRKKKAPQNGRATMPALDFNRWAKVTGATPKEIESAWNDLQRRSLTSVRQGKVKISAEAMTRANTDVQRRLASYLSGYELTENSYINNGLFAKLLFDCMFSAALAQSVREQGFDVAEARFFQFALVG